MEILIVGSGRIGSKVIQALAIDKVKITVIDTDYTALTKVSHSKDVKTIYANGMDKEVLSALDIKKFDFTLALTNSDKTNILVCTTLKNMGAKYTIARINSTESIDDLFLLKESLGIDYIVNPQLEVARTIRTIIEEDRNYQRDSFAKGRIQVVGHEIVSGSTFIGEKLKDIGSLATVLIAAISRKSGLIIPSGDTIIEDGDYLYLIGLTKDIIKFKNTYFKFTQKKEEKDIAILGSGGITEELTKRLEDSNVKIIVNDDTNLYELRHKLPEALIVKQKLAGADLFKHEDIDEVDDFVALTDNDELNIALSLMAKKVGAKNVIAKVESLNYSKIVDELNFITLNPMIIAANKIIKKIRKDHGISIHLMFGGEAEVSEIKLSDDSEVIGKTLEEINLPKGILIGGIVRKDETAIVPRGRTKIEQGDTIVVFCKNENKRELMQFINPNVNRGFLSDLFLYK